MVLIIYVSHLILLIWTFGVDGKKINERNGNFIQVTERQLVYFPQPRIVGGQDAKDNQFPYQVSLRVYNHHICGGSIISENYVVTAAHCVSSSSGNSIHIIPKSILAIHAGSREINFGGVVVGVSQVIVHPNYKNFNNDIAILKLEKPLEFNNGIQPVALATKNPKEGAKVITTGWGRLRTNGVTPQILQLNTLTYITNAKCGRRIGYVPKSTLCLAHTMGNGVCSGDSGGPAVYNNQLVGVTNFVVGECGSNDPDGYASIPFFAEWIRSNTNLK